MADRMTLEDLDRLKEILGPSKPMIGNDDDPVVVVNATQWLVLATDIGKITYQRDELLKALKHIADTGQVRDAYHVRDLFKLIAECEK